MFEYAAVLAGCLLLTLPLDVVWRLRVYARWLTLAATVVPIAAVFTLGDIAAYRRGWWRWNPRFTLRPRVVGLPLEEIAFFLVIPVASILTWEVVHRVLDGPVPPDSGGVSGGGADRRRPSRPGAGADAAPDRGGPPDSGEALLDT
jgi:lycopene cyclase domain-containing protein